MDILHFLGMFAAVISIVYLFVALFFPEILK